jgi:hypothetical protein
MIGIKQWRRRGDADPGEWEASEDPSHPVIPLAEDDLPFARRSSHGLDRLTWNGRPHQDPASWQGRCWARYHDRRDGIAGFVPGRAADEQDGSHDDDREERDDPGLGRGVGECHW